MVDLNTDTIAAVATAAGRAGVGIVRISGKDAKSIGETIAQISLKPRYAHFGSFYANSEAVDQGIIIYFQGPHSFTGEDVVELQAHGGPILLNQLLAEVVRLGARQAKPGEFSERAFLNDKIDLAQAEAIADLINADSQAAARSAMNSLQGEFSKKIHNLVEQVIQLRIYIEAAIDFPEEEVDFLQDQQIQTSFSNLEESLQTILSQAKQGSLLKEGINAVILGKPNAGKSSLLNALAQREAAIVTPIQGTTRDILKEHILIDSLPVHLIDTAGIRESTDIVEQEGIRRANQVLDTADLVIIVNDASEHQETDLDYFLSELKQIDTQALKQAKYIIVQNKCDLINKTPYIEKQNDNQGSHVVYVSAKQQEGITLLKQCIKDLVEFNVGESQEGIFSARQRHRDALDKALEFLLTGKQQLNEFQAGELVAEDLRQCQYALSEITGEFTPDDLLGEIFSSFCIGK